MKKRNPAAGRYWFEQWFDDNYLKLYRHRNRSDARRQVHLILNTLKPGPEDRILDLACGDGRHVELFHEMGFHVSGIDLSPVLIERGLQRNPNLNIQTGDMRHIQGTFTIILSLFTSFGYFDDHEENHRILAGISAALEPDGWFWIDFLNPSHVRKTLVPESNRQLDDGSTVIEHRSIQGNMVVKDIIFVTPDGERYYQERVRLYHREELITMLDTVGIRVCGGFGDYDGSPWWSDSPRTILYGKKP